MSPGSGQQRRRLLFVSHFPVFGGPHNQALRLAAPLREAGIDTVVLLPDEEGNAASRLAEAGLEVLTRPLQRVRATPDVRVQARFLSSLVRDVRTIRNLIEEHRIDLVQATGLMNPHAPIAARLARRPLVWQLLDTRPPPAARRAFSPLVPLLADVAMSTGIEVGRLHPGVERLGRRWVPFFPPVDTDLFRPDEQVRQAARRELEVPDGSVVLGTVGNLNPQKGHEHLLRAAALLHRTIPRLCVRVLGAAHPTHRAYEQSLLAEARELGLSDGTIRFVDPGDRVPELLPALDVFAMASVPNSEGVPTVVLEAMACAIPVVVTEVGSVREIVEPGRTGALVNPLDPPGMAAALEPLLRDPEARRELGEQARRRAVERYGLDACVRTHLHAYGLALRGR